MINSDYIQPNFYHFSQDSIELAKFAFKDFPKAKSICDIGAGCGVVSLELKQISDQVEHIIFIEKQLEFKESLQQNIQKFASDIHTEVYYGNFSELNLDSQVDLIITNPPYFDEKKTRSSTDFNKKNCQQFSDNFHNLLFSFIVKNLKKSGKAYMSFREEYFNLSMIKSYNNKVKVFDLLGPTKVLIYSNCK